MTTVRSLFHTHRSAFLCWSWAGKIASQAGERLARGQVAAVDSDVEEGDKMGSSWDHAEPLLSDQPGLRSISSPDGGKKERLQRRQLWGNISRSCQSKVLCIAVSLVQLTQCNSFLCSTPAPLPTPSPSFRCSPSFLLLSSLHSANTAEIKQKKEKQT